MKRLQICSVIAGLLISTSVPAFAGGWRGGRGGGFSRGGGAVAHAGGYRSYAGYSGFRANNYRSFAPSYAVRSPAFSRGAAFTRSYNYGGRWAAASAHPGWRAGSAYYWHNHYYRWYNGGWLIADGGFWPYGYGYPYPYNYAYPSYGSDNYSQPSTSTSDSTVANVQSDLEQQGYYNGAIDGVIGPMTRQAIENYQSDYGLPVTGVVDEQLLKSLGLS